ncbi:matrixin family metalloprotease [Mariniblastus sp.]|nr:matrixin family metalloprotease [Mariniblastus sp.]
MFKRLASLVFVVLTLSTQVATAQPPAATRWTGNTANAQSQGFAQGDPLVLTWSLAPDGTPVGAVDPTVPPVSPANSNLIEFLDDIYGDITVYQPILQDAFGRWGEVSGLTILHESADDGIVGAFGQTGVRGDVRIDGGTIDGPQGVLAVSTVPNDSRITVDTSDGAFFGNTGLDSLRLRNVLTHEFGHSLGFFTAAEGGHIVSDDTRQLLEPTVDLNFDGPQYHDILSVQREYGDALETGLGNDSSDIATDLGLIDSGDAVLLGGSANRTTESALFPARRASSFTGANDAFEILPDEVDFISIDDQSDTDVFKFTIGELGFVDIVLDTLGETYQIAGQVTGGITEAAEDSAGVTQVDFNTLERVNLGLELLGPDGETVIASSNSGGFGDDEFLSGIELAEGTYFVRIFGENNLDTISLDTQFYGLSVGFQAVAVPEPSSFAVLSLLGALCLTRRKRLQHYCGLVDRD